MKTFFQHEKGRGDCSHDPSPLNPPMLCVRLQHKIFSGKMVCLVFFTVVLYTLLNSYTTCKQDRSVKSSATVLLLLCRYLLALMTAERAGIYGVRLIRRRAIDQSQRELITPWTDENKLGRRSVYTVYCFSRRVPLSTGRRLVHIHNSGNARSNRLVQDTARVTPTCE